MLSGIAPGVDVLVTEPQRDHRRVDAASSRRIAAVWGALP